MLSEIAFILKYLTAVRTIERQFRLDVFLCSESLAFRIDHIFQNILILIFGSSLCLNIEELKSEESLN